MKSLFEQGARDKQNGDAPREPKKDVLDAIGLGYTDKQVDRRGEEYREGYKSTDAKTPDNKASK